MSFNFDELLNQGRDAANLVIQNKREIKDVFDNLESSLSRFLELEVTIVEETAYEDDNKHPIMRTVTLFEPRKITGYNYVSVRHEESGVKRQLMLVKRSSEGYPITVVDGKNHYTADTQGEFAQALGTVIANSQTNLKLRGLKRAVAEALEKSADNGAQ